MQFYSLSIRETLKKLNSKKEGLSQEEACERLKKYGKNKIINQEKETIFSKFLNQFKDLMVIILLISATFSFVLSILNNESFIDSIIILIIVILNAILRFIQESKADKAIESLKNLQMTTIKVKRDNKIFVINSEDIVKGDILVLEAGDMIPADARIIWQTALKVDESSLTGESIPVSKAVDTLVENTILSKRKNMIYTGTNIVYGKCNAVVCETGMNTEFGFIAKCLNESEKENTIVQRKIDEISKIISFIIFLIIVIMFIIGITKGMNIKEITMLSISLAVAAIPEGLQAIITIILSLSMNTMAKKNAIIRKMSSIETLGSIEVICSDKTGTITQNKMEVQKVYYNNKIYSYNELDKKCLILSIMALNNDTEKNDNKYIGDPTEIALYKACEKQLNIDKLITDNVRIDELPFDSNRKMMSTINKNGNNITLYTKGSFDSIIKRCTHIYENNNIYKITAEKIKKLKEIEKQESNKSYRILAYAYKELNASYTLNTSLENNLIFVGMTAMIDPPRPDVKNSIEECKIANIKPIMITGDSLSTAISIAKEIGILKNEDKAITGDELDKMSKEELINNINKYTVYARVSPTNKFDIVDAFKKSGKTVAMTGDGVNDAPALKIADIGIGMGINGTEVSKNVSDIILTDDSFSTIITAIKEGRKIFDNIKKVLIYLLTGNIAEVLVIFIGMLFGIEIFLPIQLLYINLITDSIPAISLAFEDCEENIMNRQDNQQSNSFFTPFSIAKMCLSALSKTTAIILIYFVNLKLYNQEIATTTSFLTLILLEMVFTYSCKNLKKNVINKKLFNNKYMNKSILILVIIQIIIFTTPLKNIFNITNLTLFQIIYCLTIVILIFLLDELSKNIINKLFKD